MYNRRSVLKLAGMTGTAVSLGTMSTKATSQNDFDEYDYLEKVVNDGTGRFELDPGQTVRYGGLTQSVYLLNKDSRVGAPPQFEIGVAVHGEAPDLYHHQDGIRAQGTTVRVRNADVWAPNSTGSVGVFPETEDASSTGLDADIAVTMLTAAFEEVGAMSNPVSAAMNIGYNVMTSSSDSVNELDSEFTLGFNHDDEDVGNVRYGHMFRFPIQPHSYDSRVYFEILSKSTHTSQDSADRLDTETLDCKWANCDQEMDYNEEQLVGRDRIALKYGLVYYESQDRWNLYNLARYVPEDGNTTYTHEEWKDRDNMSCISGSTCN